MTGVSVDYLSKCESLIFLDLRQTFISHQKILDFVNNSNLNLYVSYEKLVKKRKQLLTLNNAINNSHYGTKKLNMYLSNKVDGTGSSNNIIMMKNNIMDERRHEMT